MATGKNKSLKSKQAKNSKNSGVKSNSVAVQKKLLKVSGKKIKMVTKNILKPEPKTHSYINKEGKRIRKVTHHRSFRLSKREIIKTKKIPKVKVLIKETNLIFWRNKVLFLKFVLLFSFLDFLFVKGLGSNFNLVDTKQNLVELIGSSNSLETSALLFGQLISSSSVSASSSSGVYHYFLVVVIILSAVWMVRHINNGLKPSLKEALYSGMAPIIKFIAVLFVITLQLMPALIGGFLVGTVFSNGLAVTNFEKFVWVVFYVGLMLVSLYMILSSMFALAIVTLEGVEPLVALRSSRDIVMHRRMKILVRLVALSILVTIVYALIFVPLILYIPVFAEPLFLIISTFTLIYSTVYIYNLYRQLL